VYRNKKGKAVKFPRSTLLQMVSGRYLESQNLDSVIPRQCPNRVKVTDSVRVRVSYDCPDYDCPEFDCPDIGR